VLCRLVKVMCSLRDDFAVAPQGPATATPARVRTGTGGQTTAMVVGGNGTLQSTRPWSFGAPSNQSSQLLDPAILTSKAEDQSPEPAG
jgi:hypothetical protein